MNRQGAGGPNDPCDEDLEKLFIACWKTMHRHKYDIQHIPNGKAFAAFFNRRQLTRLLRRAISGQCDDLLYVALQMPLNLTTINGGIALQAWWSRVVWLKRNLVLCVEGWPDDIQIARKPIKLSELLSFPLRT